MPKINEYEQPPKLGSRKRGPKTLRHLIQKNAHLNQRRKMWYGCVGSDNSNLAKEVAENDDLIRLLRQIETSIAKLRDSIKTSTEPQVYILQRIEALKDQRKVLKLKKKHQRV
jgi:hypothetical protein